jgi:hypothetical protein
MTEPLRYAVREVDRESELEHEADAIARTPPAQSPTAAPTMTPEQVDDRIEQQLLQVGKALSREAGKHELALRSEFRASIEAVKRDLDVLREENVKLRIELAARGVQDRSGSEILDLPALPSRRANLNG